MTGRLVGLALAALAAACVPAQAAYTYYFNDTFASSGSGWSPNGTVTIANDVFTNGDANGASLISTTAMPDGTSDNEVKANLKITGAGGYYAL